MHTHVYLSNTHNPWFNLATEDWLFQQAPLNEQVLFLWRNQPCVVIGRAQNPWAECNLAHMAEDDVLLARRQSGGGTVFHDLGNTNFTFISPLTQYDKNLNLALILKALAHFGMNAYASGRNDLCVNDLDGQPRKFSGSAFRQTADKAFHHGTLLLDANLDNLNHYLHPNKLKLESKGVKSVRSRVMNLRELNPTINHTEIGQVLIQQFFDQYEHIGAIDTLDEGYLKTQPALMARYQEYSDWDWRFGKTLPFDLELNHRFSWGDITLQLKFDQAIISHAMVYSDCLYPELMETLQARLVNMICSGKKLQDITLGLTQQFPQQTALLQDLADWLHRQMA
jgi:lipoate-protein ligase A